MEQDWKQGSSVECHHLDNLDNMENLEDTGYLASWTTCKAALKLMILAACLTTPSTISRNKFANLKATVA